MMSGHTLMSSRRLSAGFLETSVSNLSSGREGGGGGGEGRNWNRFQRRGWGSTTGSAVPPSLAGNNAANNPNTAGPPSLNLVAVMSFPPMSDEDIARSNSAEAAADLRRSNNSSMWGEQRSQSLRPSGSNQQLHQNSFTGQSLTGMSLASGSIGTLRDDSVSEHVEGGEENISMSKLPPMPLHSSFQKTTGRSASQNSITTGLTPHQRARFSESAGSTGGASRVRLDTGGSNSTRSRLDKPNDFSENSDRAGTSSRQAASNEHGSDSSWVDETENGGADEDTEGGDSATLETRKGIFFCGLELPHWLISWRPSLHRVSTMVVTRAPCFICWGFRQPTDRSILARLNILVVIFTSLQIASTIFMAAVSWNRPDEYAIGNLTDEEESAKSTRGPVLFNVWTTNVYIYFTGMLAFLNFTSAVFTIRVIRNVNLVGAIRYLWVLLWVLPLQFQSNIGLFDYFRVTDVWIKHYWRDSSMSWFRRRFCVPAESADFECTVPRADNATETEWCLRNFNSTNCSSIRNSAQSEMERSTLIFYYLNASIGLALICLLVLTVNALERIISKPLVQKSRESNVPAWMSLPIVSCVTFGLIFSFSSSSVLNTRTQSEATWIGPLFLVAATLFFIAAMIGWCIRARPVMSTRQKRNKLISIWAFIIVMLCILILLTTIFATCIAFSVSLVDVPISSTQRGDIACFLDESGSCTRCELGPSENRCPEWSVADVTKVIRTQAKASASLAAMLMLYALSALRFGLGLRTHIRLYQIDYI